MRDALDIAFEQWAADAESFGRAFQAPRRATPGTDANFTADVNGVHW